MGIFNEFFKKEKPVFTGLKFGFGSGGGGGGGDAAPNAVHSATGATIFDVESNGRAVIQFNTPGSITFDTSMSGKDLRIILVGGGGAGSTGNAGGGGAGGMIEITSSTIGAGTYPVTIGTPGPHPGATGTKGSPGGHSTFGPGLTAYGGGAGGRDTQSADDGGSGGGAGYNVGRGNPSQVGFPIPGSYSGSNYGNDGAAHPGSPTYPCGGGGGAGGVGGQASPPLVPRRPGGPGRTVPSPNFPGVPFSGQLVAGGGGGSARGDAGADTAGPGGGGQGCSCDDGVATDPACANNAMNGTANTGGGGGGSRCSNGDAGQGGTGLCIVSYSLS